jgi:hypothetical protein
MSEQAAVFWAKPLVFLIEIHGEEEGGLEQAAVFWAKPLVFLIEIHGEEQRGF